MGLDLGFGILSEDPWLTIEARWKEGKRDLSDLFPSGWSQVLEGEPRPGDFLMIRQKGTPSHVVLMAPIGFTLSAQEAARSRFVRFDDWRPRLHSVWRPRVE
jgi:hypothetical protein